MLALGDRTFSDMKTLALGAAHFESTSAAFSHSAEKRQKQVSPACRAAARSLDAELDAQPGSPWPVESELNTWNSGEGRGPRRRRVRGAVQRIPRRYRPDRLSTRRWASPVLRHRPRDVQVHLPPAGREGSWTRTAPRVGQIRARPLPGL